MNVIQATKSVALKGKENFRNYGVFGTKGVKRKRVNLGEPTEFNGGHVITLVFWAAVFYLMIGLSQTKLMIYEVLENEPFPWMTMFWVSMFSLSLYFSRNYSFFIGLESDNRRSVKFVPNTVDFFILVVPHLCVFLFLLVRGFIDIDEPSKWWNLPFFILVLFGYYYVIRSLYKLDFDKMKNAEPFFGRMTFLTLLLILFGMIHYLNTDTISISKYSVSILNILLISLMTWRLVLLLFQFALTPIVALLKGLSYWVSKVFSANSQRSYELPRFRYFASRLLLLAILTFIVKYVDKSYYKFTKIELLEERAELNEYAKTWLDSYIESTDSGNIYLVAGQGGGSRAGLWMVAGLDTMSAGVSDFNRGLFGISTVSGSTVGASMFYLNHITEQGALGGYLDPKGVFKDEYKGYFNRDFVSKSIAHYLLWNGFAKLYNGEDRNDVLQKEYNDAYEDHYGHMKEGYSSISFPIITKADREKPILVFNSYNITDKKKAVVSSVEMRDEVVVDDVLKSLGANLKLDDAVNLSEMFPFISASAKLDYDNRPDTCVYKRFYDGGVYDNYGVSSLKILYNSISAFRDSLSCEKKRRIIALVFKNSTDNIQSELSMNNGIGALIDGIKGSLFSAHTNSELNELRSEMTMKRDEVIEFEFEDTVTLNRWLSLKSINAMIQKRNEKMTGVIKSIEELNLDVYPDCTKEHDEIIRRQREFENYYNGDNENISHDNKPFFVQ